MEQTNGDARPAPFRFTADEDAERPERLRVYPADAPPPEWEDEHVDLGGEG
jgi:hypothetical protein